MEKELIVKWRIKESETAGILNLLPELVDKTRKEKGNILYHIYQSADNDSELFLHERYIDADALEIHKNTAHYQQIVMGRIIPNLEVREVTLLKKLF